MFTLYARNVSLQHERVDASVCYLKFSRVVLAHILGKMGIFCTVLLSVSTGTCLPIFIEISLYLIDTEQK